MVEYGGNQAYEVAHSVWGVPFRLYEFMGFLVFLAVIAGGILAFLLLSGLLERLGYSIGGKGGFRELKIKLVARTAGICLAAALVGMLLNRFVVEGVLQDAAANLMVDLGIYRFMQNYKPDILGGCFVLLILCVLYLIFSRISYYLNLVGDAVDQVFEKTPKLIVLPHELKAIERKLNSIKDALRKQDREARESEQRKNDLIVYLAHDIRTPLTSVIGYLTVLEKNGEGTEQERERYLSIALEKSRRLEMLTAELFEVARFSAGAIQLDSREFSLSVMLRQLTEEFFPLFTQRSQSCTLEAPPGLLCFGDADRLARVFDNLLRNAISYTPVGGAITVSAESGEQELTIAFANEGEAIPPEKLAHIFEKFYRADDARSSGTGGSGLGLAIAREIVELHGGRVTAESTSEATVFRVVLPVPPADRKK